jgi:hypothetical protein
MALDPVPVRIGAGIILNAVPQSVVAPGSAHSCVFVSPVVKHIAMSDGMRAALLHGTAEYIQSVRVVVETRIPTLPGLNIPTGTTKTILSTTAERFGLRDGSAHATVDIDVVLHFAPDRLTSRGIRCGYHGSLASSGTRTAVSYKLTPTEYWTGSIPPTHRNEVFFHLTVGDGGTVSAVVPGSAEEHPDLYTVLDILMVANDSFYLRIPQFRDLMCPSLGARRHRADPPAEVEAEEGGTHVQYRTLLTACRGMDVTPQRFASYASERRLAERARRQKYAEAKAAKAKAEAEGGTKTDDVGEVERADDDDDAAVAAVAEEEEEGEEGENQRDAAALAEERTASEAPTTDVRPPPAPATYYDLGEVENDDEDGGDGGIPYAYRLLSE